MKCIEAQWASIDCFLIIFVLRGSPVCFMYLLLPPANIVSVIWFVRGDNRSLIHSTKFKMDLRQLNKPAIGEAWPLSLSMDGKSAFVGLERDTFLPLVATPTSTLAELKDKVGLVANSVAFSTGCRTLALSDFADIFIPECKMDGDLSCVWVMNVAGQGEIRELCGLERAVRSLAISGRHCLTTNINEKI